MKLECEAVNDPEWEDYDGCEHCDWEIWRCQRKLVEYIKTLISEGEDPPEKYPTV